MLATRRSWDARVAVQEEAEKRDVGILLNDGPHHPATPFTHLGPVLIEGMPVLLLLERIVELREQR